MTKDRAMNDYTAIIFTFALWGYLELLNVAYIIRDYFFPPMHPSMSKESFIDTYAGKEEPKEEPEKNQISDGKWEHVAIVKTRNKTDLDRIKSIAGNVEIINDKKK